MDAYLTLTLSIVSLYTRAYTHVSCAPNKLTIGITLDGIVYAGYLYGIIMWIWVCVRVYASCDDILTLNKPTTFTNDLGTSCLRRVSTCLIFSSKVSACVSKGKPVKGGWHRIQILLAPMNNVMSFQSSLICR